MLFNSIGFVVFFILVFTIWWMPAMQTVRRRNILIILTGSFFYGCWDVRFLLLLYFTATVDFLIAKAIERSADEKKRKRLLLISLLSNLTVLGFFKYFNFFADSFSELFSAIGLHADFVTLQIALPVGISFYTFQALSYTIDVYRKRTSAVHEWHVYFAFITFFAQLVAGPIARSEQLIPQMRRLNIFSYAAATSGLRLLLWGFFKKCVIADNLSPFVDAVFSSTAHPNAMFTTLGIIAFAIQVYADFSGYSDIARGSARILGIDLALNFRLPYFATTIKDFWRRWHMSLSAWFNDYVFTPFIIAKRNWGNAAVIIGLLLTFTLSGLWHGAGWTFVCYGLWLGFAITVEFSWKLLKLPAFPKLVRHALVLLVICLGYVLFRSPDGATALYRYATLFTGTWSFNDTGISLPETFLSTTFLAGLILLCVLLFVAEWLYSRPDFNLHFHKHRVLRIATYYSLIACSLMYGVYSGPPAFIYFQF